MVSLNFPASQLKQFVQSYVSAFILHALYFCTDTVFMLIDKLVSTCILLAGTWLAAWPHDLWMFRPSNVDADRHLLLVHQSQWQRRLMLCYGQELVFLDATYKTTQYALPLFFLCVHTNLGYIVVAVMAIEREDSEALAILRQSAADWTPLAFMMDSSEVEITAVNAVFPGLLLITVLHRLCVMAGNWWDSLLFCMMLKCWSLTQYVNLTVAFGKMIIYSETCSHAATTKLLQTLKLHLLPNFLEHHLFYRSIARFLHGA